MRSANNAIYLHLVVLREQAVARVRARREELDAVSDPSMTDGRDDEHDPDGATVAFEHSLAVGLLTQAQSDLAEVEAAVARVAADAYGSCVRCGLAIPRERLEALPATSTCAPCRARMVGEGRLPGGR